MLKKLYPFLILGLVIRIVLSAVSYHSDVQHFDLAGTNLMKGNFLNFYDSIPTHPFNYPPLVYYSLGLVDGILTSFQDESFHNNFLFDYPKVLGDFRLNIHLILLKLPYLVVDFGILYPLLKIFRTEKERRITSILWIFNPINLYATYLIGQFDIIPVFFVLLSIHSALEKKMYWAAFFLGIGAGFKNFPLFLIIPLASIVWGWRGKIKVACLGFLTYFTILLPFLPSKGFRMSALVASQSLKSLYAQIPVSAGEALLVFPTLLILFYLIFLGIRENLWQKFFITLLLFFIFTHYHPQWFLWLTPFMIFDVVLNKFKNILPHILMIISFLGLITFFDTGLTIGLFSPLTGQFSISNSLWQVIGINIDQNFARSFLQTIFAGGAFYLIYCYFPKAR